MSDPPGTETRSRRHMKRKTSRKKGWLIGAGSVECPDGIGDTPGVFVQLPSGMSDRNSNVPVACSPSVKQKFVKSLGYQFFEARISQGRSRVGTCGTRLKKAGVMGSEES